MVKDDGVNPVMKVLMKTNGFGLIAGHKGVSSLSDFGIKLKTLICFDPPMLRSIWAKDSLE